MTYFWNFSRKYTFANVLYGQNKNVQLILVTYAVNNIIPETEKDFGKRI